MVLFVISGQNGDSDMATITRRESGRWQAKVRKAGAPAISRTFRTKADAEAWARKEESAQERGVWRDTGDGDRTLDDLLDEFARERLPALRSAATPYFLARWREDFGKRRISTMTPRDMAAWRDARLKIVAAGTVAREMSFLRGVFSWAIKRKLYNITSPLAGVPAPPPPQARARRLSEVEQARLREALTDAARPTQGAKRSGNYRTGARNALLAPLLDFARETGMRRGEICAMLWAWIDLGAPVPTVSIPAAATKTQRARVVPLTSVAEAILRTLPRPAADEKDQRVFPVTAGAVTQAIRRARKRAGLADVRLHDMRHEAVSRFIELDMSVSDAMAIAGHSDPRSSARYTHLDPQRLGAKLRKQEAASSADSAPLEKGSKFKSAALEAIHTSATAMYKAGTIDKAAMKHFDAVCLTKKGVAL